MKRREFFGLALGVVALDPREAIIPPHKFQVPAGRQYGMSSFGGLDWDVSVLNENIRAALRREAARRG